MNRMRFLPRKIGTLEREIERDREDLQRIRNDLLYETEQHGILRRKERTRVERIERRMEDLNRLRMENMKLRQKMAEVIA